MVILPKAQNATIRKAQAFLMVAFLLFIRRLVGSEKGPVDVDFRPSL
jgi:hypothetical protein